MRRFALPLVACLAAVPALAQGARPPAPPAAKPEPPKAATPRPSTMDDLFERLAAAKDESEGKGIASLIERRWARSGSDTADLLMSRAAEAARAKDYPLAVELLDRVLVLEPKWAEAWHRRANVFYLLDDPVSAMADLRRALAIEPRHFSAWAGLGHIFMASDDKRGAMEAYRRALKIHPQQETVRTRVERLTPEVDGQNL
ncbi:MAG TPA: tetratricopeptide repeat protein [Microvirga sp.]|jgi:Tfp pilus assembly protein PilF|nr:tetratricopeptide repeat protein [Microvirga sp.]